MMEVRAGFGAKLRKSVLLLNAQQGTVQRASKYAAMLPLAGMDPNEPNRCLDLLWPSPLVARHLWSCMLQDTHQTSSLFLFQANGMGWSNQPDAPQQRHACGCLVRRCAAYGTLSEFVVLRRRAAAKAVAAAAQAGGAGGTVLQEFPEFMLPFVVQVGGFKPADCRHFRKGIVDAWQT